MPPKDKAKAAAKSKAAEDKTFGLKNKNKSKAVQQYVKQVESSQAAQNTQKAARIAAASGVVNVKDKKKAEEERKAEMAALFAVAIKQPKVPPGVDPKSMLCEFFRHGQCTKAFKCKFSHDLNVEKKGPKIDLFQDKRDGAEEDQEGMEDWDQAELERVVKEKHGAEKPSNATTIICKFFLDAVEKHQYGWFWKCPNGAECKYRHALPAGYVLKSQMKELLEEEARNVRDIAEQIEEERAKIDARTPITEEVFSAWRQRKVAVRQARKAAEEEERKKKGIMTGREIFMQDGFVYEDDAGASGADDLKREGQDEEEEAIRQMLENARNAAARAKERAETEPSSIKRPKADDDEEEDEEEEEEEEEAGGAGAAEEPGGSAAGPSGSGAGPSGATQLQPGDDEELFGGDDDDDDDMLEDDEDLEDDELDELEQGIKGTQLGGEGPSKS